MTTFRRLGAALALSASLVLGLTACGGEVDVEDDRTGAAEPFTKESFFATTTAASLAAGSYHVEMTVDAGQQSMRADGDVLAASSPEDVLMRMTMALDPMGEIELRFLDGMAYMNMGEASDGKFMMIDPAGSEDPMSQQLSSMMDDLDAAKQLEQIQRAVTRVEREGAPETVDGVEATPYRVTVDTDVLADQLEDFPEDVPMPGSLTYVFLVGPDDLPRRMELEIAGVETIMSFSRWGEPVEIEKPTAEEITDLTFDDLGSGVA